MCETAVRLLKLEGAGEIKSGGIHILKGAERILLLGGIFYGGTRLSLWVRRGCCSEH